MSAPSEQVGWLCHAANGQRHFIWLASDPAELDWLRSRYVRFEPLVVASEIGACTGEFVHERDVMACELPAGHAGAHGFAPFVPSSIERTYAQVLADNIEECFKVASNEEFVIRRSDAESMIAALRRPIVASAIGRITKEELHFLAAGWVMEIEGLHQSDKELHAAAKAYAQTIGPEDDTAAADILRRCFGLGSSSDGRTTP